MRKISPHSLWIGHVGDIRNLRNVLDAGIAAVVDLALDEPLPTLTRDLVYCRFPIVDGGGNPAWILQGAIETATRLLQDQIPTLLFCGPGMSRSPGIAAAALAFVTNRPPDDCLVEATQGGAFDVTPALWRDICVALDSCIRRHQPPSPRTN